MGIYLCGAGPFEGAVMDASQRADINLKMSIARVSYVS